MPEADACAEVDDDTCITLATLHGAEFENEAYAAEDYELWWLTNNRVVADILSDRSKDENGFYGAPSRAWIARAYCKYYGLI